MILIIDSEKISESKIKQSFIELAIESIVIARTAQQARALLQLNEKKFSVDDITLIIIASQIDDANEFELCRELNKIPAAKNIYTILLVSSAENKTAIEKAKHSGASDFAVKPYNSPAFKTRFARYIKSKAVLLVEDDPLIRIMVRSMLTKYHVELLEIDDGVHAHNLFNTMLPVKLVLMDIGLPNMNGIKLLQQLRSKVEWQKTPVVMLTGSSDVANVKKSLSAGANDYITKPFKIDAFIAHLNRYLPSER